MDYKRLLSRVKTFAVIMLALLTAGEIGLRLGLGIGNPVLMKAGKTYRYICVPNQNLHRFGNHVFINRWSMRSNHIDRTRRDANELRVMVIGDSVIFGTTLLDQSEIATSMMIPMLSDRLRRPVKTMNVSAGSWNIPDQTAYLEEFGTFDADIIVWVLNSGDLQPNDFSTPVVGVHPQFPDRRPLTAIGELLGRYLLPKLKLRSAPLESASDYGQAEIQRVAAEFRNSLALLKEAGVRVIIVLYPMKKQLDGIPTSFDKPISDAARQAGVETIDLTARIRDATYDGADFYYDAIHATREGQYMLARWLTELITERLGA